MINDSNDSLNTRRMIYHKKNLFFLILTPEQCSVNTERDGIEKKLIRELNKFYR